MKFKIWILSILLVSCYKFAYCLPPYLYYIFFVNHPSDSNLSVVVTFLNGLEDVDDQYFDHNILYPLILPTTERITGMAVYALDDDDFRHPLFYAPILGDSDWEPNRLRSHTIMINGALIAIYIAKTSLDPTICIEHFSKQNKPPPPGGAGALLAHDCPGFQA